MGKFKYGFYGTLTTGSLVKIFSALEKEAGMHKGDTFCDFGAGLGGVLLFAQALGYSSYGVEFDGDKARQAYTACCLAYKRYRVEFGHLSDEMESKLLWYEVDEIKNVTTQFMPTGASVFFSFWQGIPAEDLEHIGRLAVACPNFRLFCFVERGN
ncbi:hypothetical protein N2152v2_006864, partial [Parachlorella kessleri]